MNYENKDRELNLKMLLFALARRWRQMLVAALIFALVLGAFGGWKCLSDRTSPATLAAQQEYEEEYASYEAMVKQYQEKIAILQENARLQKDYLDNSVLMQMDYRNTWLATLSLYVEAEENIQISGGEFGRTRSEIIAEAYLVALTDSRVLTKAAQALGVEVRYLRETVNIFLVGAEDGQGSPLLAAEVRGPNGIYVAQVITELRADLEVLYKEISESVGAHSIREISYSATERVDQELAEVQTDAVELWIDYTEDLADYQEELDDLEEPVPPKSSSLGKSVILFGIVGGIAGVFIVAVWGCVAYVVGDKVYAAEELKSRFNMAILGKISVKARKRCFVERWLDRAECRGKTEEDGALDVICANVCNHLPHGATLLVAGAAGEDHVQWIAEALSKKLAGSTVLVGGNLLESIPAIEGLSKCDSVLLVERCGVSRYSQIKNQIEAVLGVNKQLIGCITLEK